MGPRHPKCHRCPLEDPNLGANQLGRLRFCGTHSLRTRTVTHVGAVGQCPCALAPCFEIGAAPAVPRKRAVRLGMA